jgi:hypothetical protein
MTVEIIGIIALAIGFISMFMPVTFILYSFAASTLLQAAAAFNLDSIGGLSISPAHLLLGFLIVRLFSDSEIRLQASDALAFGKPGFWLMTTVGLSILTALFMPRIFEGQTFVFAVRATYGGAELLQPATSNITQSIYFTADATCFLAFAAFAGTRGGVRTLLNVGLFCATLNLVFAFLDLLTYFTNTTEIFDLIRNARYNQLADTEVAGFKRIVGSFVEASSFGSATLGYFGLTLRLWLLGYKPRLTFSVCWLSFTAILFATSTTAYVGLTVFLGFTYLELLLRGISRPLTRPTRMFLVAAPILLLIAVLVIALSDTYSDYVQNLLDTFFFNKLSTASGVERSAWNRQSIQSFFDTYGFGVGNGSSRASSFPVAALASLGIVGVIPFILFFLSLFIGRGTVADPIDDAARQAARAMTLACLISGTVSAALIELGLIFYAFAGLAGSDGTGSRLWKSRSVPQLRDHSDPEVAVPALPRTAQR